MLRPHRSASLDTPTLVSRTPFGAPQYLSGRPTGRFWGGGVVCSMVAMAAQMGSPDKTDAPNSVVGRRASAARAAKCCERSSLSLEFTSSTWGMEYSIAGCRIACSTSCKSLLAAWLRVSSTATSTLLSRGMTRWSPANRG